MAQWRPRPLAGFVIAFAVLLAALGTWSQIRVRAARAEIDALASETDELGASNRRLRERIESEVELRDSVRSSCDPLELTPVRPDITVRATIYYDQLRRVALLSLESTGDAAPEWNVLVESGDGAIRSSSLPADLVDGNEILLTDLPAEVTAFSIAISDGARLRPVLKAEVPTVP